MCFNMVGPGEASAIGTVLASPARGGWKWVLRGIYRAQGARRVSVGMGVRW